VDDGLDDAEGTGQKALEPTVAAAINIDADKKIFMVTAGGGKLQ
jgi:hypothetical protein